MARFISDRRRFELITEEAERCTGTMAAVVTRAYKPAIRAIAKAVANHENPREAVQHFITEAHAEMAPARELVTLQCGVSGWRIAEILLGGKGARRRDFRAKVLDVTIESFGADEIVARQVAGNVGEWVENTSRIESATSANQLGGMIERSIAGDLLDDGTWLGVTPAEMAARLEAQGLAFTKGRAVLMARTTTMWAYNEGAEQFYSSEGVAAKEWLTAKDDLVCPYCGPLDGEVVSVDGGYGKKGDEVTGSDGSTLTLGIDVNHPPLHPHCRCALLPVIT